jgi:signal peptide peptidase-like 2B
MAIPTTHGCLIHLLLAVVLLACRAPPASGADSEFEDGISPKFPGCDNPFQKVRYEPWPDRVYGDREHN